MRIWLAVFVGLVCALAVSGVDAQTGPATFYGRGLNAGDRVEASINGRSCGTSFATAASGSWSISIPTNALCAPVSGASVTFTVNGVNAAASPFAIWIGGGLPPNPSVGYVLTVIVPPRPANNPATFYGRGLRAGDLVVAVIRSILCGTAQANAAGEWSISIPVIGSCNPIDGDAVAFTLNGVTAAVSPAAAWHIGGLPPDNASGYVLSAVPVSHLLGGAIPAGGGFGLVVYSGGTVEQLLMLTGCPRSSMALYVASGGDFVVYVPGAAIAAVNTAFLSLFATGIPANTAFLGKCV